MLSLVWFRRDLRVQDHPALTRAAAGGAVLPVYVDDPAAWSGGDSSGRQRAFLEESLRDLRTDLAAAGQPLILRAGDTVEVLARLRAKHRVARIVTHAETGDGAARARFAAAEGWARAAGLDWLTVAEGEGDAPCPVPVLAPVAEGTGALPGPRALGLADDPCPCRQPGGRAAALPLLDSYLSTRGQGHVPARATVLTAERNGARLSPYLAFGVISAREVRQALAQARARLRGQADWAPALRGLSARLAAREAARDLAHDLLPSAPGAPASGPWALGETGLPYVDAAMRALRATGWLDGRSRALLAAVGVHHLGLDPVAAGLHLARLSTDHDPAILWAEMARVSAGRVPDPVATGRMLDPTGAFLRRWLPELARVPAPLLHTPWLWSRARRALAGRYPEPVLDPASAGRAARRVRGLPPAARRAPGVQMALDL